MKHHQQNIPRRCIFNSIDRNRDYELEIPPKHKLPSEFPGFAQFGPPNFAAAGSAGGMPTATGCGQFLARH